MATIKLVPSSYTLSNTQYLSVTSANNMYTDTSSTSYATIYNSRNQTTTYYIYLQGFNFNSVPAEANVSSFTIRLKAYESGASTSSSYAPQLVNDTTTINGSSSAVTTTTQTLTFTGITADWDTIKNYGSDFGIRVSCRRNNKNTAAYVYIYGAEIEVTYTLPVTYNISVTNNSSGTVNPSTTQTVYEGNTYSLTISGLSETPTVTDNNVDVTSSLVSTQGGTDTLIPYDTVSNSNFTITNESNAYHDTTNNTYASLQLSAGGTTGSVYFTLGGVSIPSTATITSISASATLQYNRNGSSSGFTASCRLYTGTTAKGSSTSIVTAGGTDVAKTTFNLTPGTWTAAEIANARFYITATNNASGTTRYLYVYGVSFTVTYTIDGTVYIYTINSVNDNHTIVVAEAEPSAILYLKVNGSWVAYSKAYKKVSGSWVEQDITTLFSTNTNYVHGT